MQRCSVTLFALGICWSSIFLAGGVFSETRMPYDPYENFNRRIFACNKIIDRVLFRPVAKTYAKFTPLFLQSGIHNAFGNLNELNFCINYFLQLEPRKAILALVRCFTNTIFGLGGFFDVAAKWNLPSHPTDFGITLRKWSNRRATYLVVPILGSRSSVSLVAFPIDTALNVITYLPPAAVSYALAAGNIIQKRAEFLPSDNVANEAFDPYVFARDAYLQHREKLLNS